MTTAMKDKTTGAIGRTAWSTALVLALAGGTSLGANAEAASRVRAPDEAQAAIIAAVKANDATALRVAQMKAQLKAQMKAQRAFKPSGRESAADVLDHSPPALSWLSLGRKLTFDMRSAGSQFLMQYGAKDDLSGVLWVSAWMQQVNGDRLHFANPQLIRAQWLEPMGFLSWDPSTGVPPGKYEISGVMLCDGEGNTAQYDRFALRALTGKKNVVTIVNAAADTVQPEMVIGIINTKTVSA